jgi:hypothetical protein
VVDEAEVRALAGYGPTPSSVLQLVPYAWRVLRRRPELRKLYASQQQAHAAVRTGCGARFGEMLEDLRPSWGTDADVADALASLARARALVEERSNALDQTRQQRESQVGNVDQSLGALQAEGGRLDAERREILLRLEDCTAQHARAEALLKRTEIELRALHEAAREAAGKGAKFAPPEHAKRIASTEQRRAEQLDAVRQREGALGQAREELRGRDAALRDLARRMALVQGQRMNIEREALGQEGLRAEGVKAALAQQHDQAERSIRKLMTERHAALEGLREEIRTNDRRLHASAEELERHRLAVDAFDRRALQRGVAIVVVAAVLLLVLLGLMVRVAGVTAKP